MKLLSLSLFCTENPTSKHIDPTRAMRRIEWAIDQVSLALRKGSSAPGKALDDTGFCAIVLVGPGDVQHHVEIFDQGYCAVVAPDGQAVVVTDKMPEANAQDCLAWLERTKHYCQWCVAVEHAEHTSTRPPVLEDSIDIEALHGWVGQRAITYFKDWKNATFDRAAKTMTKANQEFEAELLRTVENLLEVTSVHQDHE